MDFLIQKCHFEVVFGAKLKRVGDKSWKSLQFNAFTEPIMKNLYWLHEIVVIQFSCRLFTQKEKEKKKDTEDCKIQC